MACFLHLQSHSGGLGLQSLSRVWSDAYLSQSSHTNYALVPCWPRRPNLR